MVTVDERLDSDHIGPWVFVFVGMVVMLLGGTFASWGVNALNGPVVVGSLMYGVGTATFLFGANLILSDRKENKTNAVNKQLFDEINDIKKMLKERSQ